MPQNPADVKKRIMAELKKRPMSVSELARRLNMRRDFISGYLEALRGYGVVKIVWIGRSKVYRPKK